MEKVIHQVRPNILLARQAGKSVAKRTMGQLYLHPLSVPLHRGIACLESRSNFLYNTYLETYREDHAMLHVLYMLTVGV